MQIFFCFVASLFALVILGTIPCVNLLSTSCVSQNRRKNKRKKTMITLLFLHVNNSLVSDQFHTPMLIRTTSFTIFCI